MTLTAVVDNRGADRERIAKVRGPTSVTGRSLNRSFVWRICPRVRKL